MKKRSVLDSKSLSNKEMNRIAGGGFITVEKIDVLTGIPGYKVKVFGVVVLQKEPIPT